MAEEMFAGSAVRSTTSGLGARTAVAIVIVLSLAIAYELLGTAGVVPLPRSIRALASEQRIGHGRALVSGYYVAQPFVSYGGPKLPPYVFASSAAAGAPAVHVIPALEDLHAGRMIAVIDNATGDGSRWSPYVIHSVMQASTFTSAAIIMTLVVLLVAFVFAGPVSERLFRARN